MTVTLKEIRERVPEANYAPMEDCKYCHGTGFNRKIVFNQDSYFPCICVFVDHSLAYEAQDLINKCVTKMRK